MSGDHLHEVTAVIPVGPGDTLYPALRTLRGPREIVVVDDPDGRGAPWARNRGFEKVRTPFVLFSDADVEWEPDAVEALCAALLAAPEAAYAYGSYEMDGAVYCDRPFDAAALRRNNFVSTMSLVRREAFPGFDEDLPRLQDWDLWLTMLEQGRTGISCGWRIFRTQKRTGISFGGPVTWEQARAIVARKHGLP